MMDKIILLIGDTIVDLIFIINQTNEARPSNANHSTETMQYDQPTTNVHCIAYDDSDDGNHMFTLYKY